MANAKPKRLFLALWPDQTVRQQCHALTQTIRQPGSRMVEPANLHVTLVFLGSIMPECQAALTQALDNVRAPVIRQTFDRLVYWKKPAVLCLAAPSVDSALSNLVTRLSIIAEQLNIPPDNRPYRPHVTLLRKARQPATAEVTAITWQADSFCLVESCNENGKPMYRVLHTWH